MTKKTDPKKDPKPAAVPAEPDQIDEEETFTRDKTLNVFQRVNLVRGEVTRVAKDKTVGTGNFAYNVTTHEAMKAILRPLMSKYGLVDLIEELEYERVDTKILRGSEGMQRPFMQHQGLYLYRCFNVDEPKNLIEFTVRGDGEDAGDKATGKATTYALKTGQKILFQVGSDENEEDRVDERDLSPVVDPNAVISDTQIDHLMELSDELFGKEKTKDILNLMADKLFGVNNVAQLKAVNFDSAVQNLRQKHHGEKVKAEKEAAGLVEAERLAAGTGDAAGDTANTDDIPPAADAKPAEPESL